LKTKKSLIFVGIIVLLIVVVFHQIIIPISATTTKVECIKWDNTYEEITELAERHNRGELDTTEHTHSFTGILPSENSDDYIVISCFFNIDNHSIIEKYVATASVIGIEKYADNVLFSVDAGAVNPIQVYRNDIAQGYVRAYVFIGNLTDEQVNELVKGVSISIEADGLLWGDRTKKISFAECDDVSKMDNRE